MLGALSKRASGWTVAVEEAQGDTCINVQSPVGSGCKFLTACIHTVTRLEDTAKELHLQPQDFHVLVNCRGFRFATMQRLCEAALLVEPALPLLLPGLPVRMARQLSLCQALGARNTEHACQAAGAANSLQSLYRLIEAGQPPGALWVSLQSLARHQCVTFSHPLGGLHAQQALHWVLFVLLLVDRAKEPSNAIPMLRRAEAAFAGHSDPPVRRAARAFYNGFCLVLREPALYGAMRGRCKQHARRLLPEALTPDPWAMGPPAVWQPGPQLIPIPDARRARSGKHRDASPPHAHTGPAVLWGPAMSPSPWETPPKATGATLSPGHAPPHYAPTASGYQMQKAHFLPPLPDGVSAKRPAMPVHARGVMAGPLP